MLFILSIDHKHYLAGVARNVEVDPIPKGETKTLAATNTQFRLQINGAINLSTMQIFTSEYETINIELIISFCIFELNLQVSILTK